MVRETQTTGEVMMHSIRFSVGKDKYSRRMFNYAVTDTVTEDEAWAVAVGYAFRTALRRPVALSEVGEWQDYRDCRIVSEGRTLTEAHVAVQQQCVWSVEFNCWMLDAGGLTKGTLRRAGWVNISGLDSDVYPDRMRMKA